MRFRFGTGPTTGLWVVLSVDAACALVAAAGLLDIRPARAAAAGTLFVGVESVLSVAAALLGATALGGLYDPQAWGRTRLLAACAARTLAIILVGVLVVALASGPLADRAHHEFWFVPAAYALTIAALRRAVAASMRGAPETPRLLSVGAGPGARGAQPLAGPGAGVGGVALHAATALPSDGKARQLTVAGGIARLADDPEAPALTRREAFRPAGAEASGGALAREAALGRVDLDTLPADWLVAAAIAREGHLVRALRRSFDVVGSLALLVAVLPVLLLTAIAIRLESRGPVFYRQERVGKDGRAFTLFKFRSMAVDAEQGGPRWALPRDPRVTRVGRIIRLTRIDEIPQVINVLRGEMALIGPRPERPAFVEQLAAVIPHYHSRHAVRPGITGWAQVNYPYGASVEDARNKLAYDLFYIRRRSLGLDAMIVRGTVRVVLFQEGAR